MTLRGLEQSDENSLELIPGKLYQYKYSTRMSRISRPATGEPIWSLPDVDTEKGYTIIGRIPEETPFMFVTIMEENKLRGHLWIKVVFGEMIGYVKISTYWLHEILELVS